MGRCIGDGRESLSDPQGRAGAKSLGLKPPRLASAISVPIVTFPPVLKLSQVDLTALASKLAPCSLQSWNRSKPSSPNSDFSAMPMRHHTSRSSAGMHASAARATSTLTGNALLLIPYSFTSCHQREPGLHAGAELRHKCVHISHNKSLNLATRNIT